MPATYVIGDIHGGLKALEQLLMRVTPAKDDRLIFLGDYVDGWSESVEVIVYLMELRSAYDCIFIKGNHDAWCEAWLNGTLPSSSWTIGMGKDTVNSYMYLSQKERKRHIDFFATMRPYFIDDKNRLFIHAGFTVIPGTVPVDFSMYRDRTLWELALTMDKRVRENPGLFPKKLLQFHEIYIGHTPTLIYGEIMPMMACNVFNMDTGSAFTGKLSAMNIDTKEVWQSDTVQSLYPNEKGRNV